MISSNPHRTPRNVPMLAVRIVAGLVLAFLVLPVFIVIPLSFTSSQLLILPMPGVSSRWYEDFFTNPLWTGALWNSVGIGIVVTVLATILGTTAALGLHNSTFKLKSAVVALLVAPLAAPIVIVAVAMFYFYARLNLVGTYLALIMAHTTLAIPFVVITVTATLQGYDRDMSRAGASLGATPLYVFRTITTPLIAPGIVSGALFAFVTSFDEIVVALFIASPEQRTLPRQIFSGVSESISPTIMAAAVVLLVISLGLMATMELLRRRSARIMATTD